MFQGTSHKTDFWGPTAIEVEKQRTVIIELQFLSSTQECKGCVFLKRLPERTETCQKDLYVCVFNFAILRANKVTRMPGDTRK